MEGKKVLWVVFSIALALVVILAAGLFLLRPRQPKSSEASVTAAPSLQGYDPYEYVRGTSGPPGLAPPPVESQPTVIVVGEPPAGVAPPAGDVPVTPAIEPLSEPGVAPSVAAPPERVGEKAVPAASLERAPQAVAAAAQPSAPPERASAPPKRAIARPAAKPKAVRVTEYWIQAGSYSSASRADEVTRRLEERGLAARTTTRDLNGKTHFRVRVGPYTSRAEAEKFLGWIRELKGFETSYISMVASRRSMP
jgi:DedD protein